MTVKVKLTCTILTSDNYTTYTFLHSYCMIQVFTCHVLHVATFYNNIIYYTHYIYSTTYNSYHNLYVLHINGILLPLSTLSYTNNANFNHKSQLFYVQYIQTTTLYTCMTCLLLIILNIILFSSILHCPYTQCTHIT